MPKVGVVITTHGFNGIYARQCIECYRRFVPDAFVVLYVNESSDPKTLSIEKDYPDVEYVYISDQKEGGGLTGTWNKGVDLCRTKECSVVVLSNDDILFDDSIVHILNAAKRCKVSEKIYYGPLTNNPGPSAGNRANQHALFAQDGAPQTCKYAGSLYNLNGFFMVFPVHVLIDNQIAVDGESYYFDPQYPFGGNETEWFTRFTKSHGIPIVVPRTFIYHYKLQVWREDDELNDICLFTINTGGYDGVHLFLRNDTDLDNLYVTDDFSMKPKTITYKCIQKGVIPLWVKSDGNPKQAQRNVKTCPTDYLPHHYKKTIYTDGNIALTKPVSRQDILQWLKEKDIVCFEHPTRNTVAAESRQIVSINLVTQYDVNQVLEIQGKNGFKDDIGLTETCILIRNHENISLFSEKWREMVNICIRDQISFDYLLWKYRVRYDRQPLVNRPIERATDHANNIRRFSPQEQQRIKEEDVKRRQRMRQRKRQMIQQQMIQQQMIRAQKMTRQLEQKQQSQNKWRSMSNFGVHVNRVSPRSDTGTAVVNTNRPRAGTGITIRPNGHPARRTVITGLMRGSYPTL